jgi:hypothetical protein
VPNLRSMIDGTCIFAAAPKASKPSPAAQHTANMIQDPLGTTKDDFEDLQQKKLEYDTARANMQMKLIGPQAVLDHVNKTHGMNNDNPDVDEFGNPINPNDPMTTGQQAPALPGKGMPGMPGQSQTGTRGMPGTKKPPMPAGMPGTPGMAPSMGQKRPPQMGMPQPGAPTTNGMPQPKGSAPAKPATKTAPAGKGKDKQIKVHVTASDSSVIQGGSSNLESQLGYGMMKAGKVIHSGDSLLASDKDKLIKACVKCGKMHVGACSDTMKADKYKMSADVEDCVDECDGDEDCEQDCFDSEDGSDMNCSTCGEMQAAGNTESAIKGWGTRGRGNPTGHASEKELKAHKKSKGMKRMKSGGPGSGRRPGGGKETPSRRTTYDQKTSTMTVTKNVNGKPTRIKLPYDKEGGEYSDKMHRKGYSQGTF